MAETNDVGVEAPEETTTPEEQSIDSVFDIWGDDAEQAPAPEEPNAMETLQGYAQTIGNDPILNTYSSFVKQGMKPEDIIIAMADTMRGDQTPRQQQPQQQQQNAQYHDDDMDLFNEDMPQQQQPQQQNNPEMTQFMTQQSQQNAQMLNLVTQLTDKISAMENTNTVNENIQHNSNQLFETLSSFNIPTTKGNIEKMNSAFKGMYGNEKSITSTRLNSKQIKGLVSMAFPTNIYNKNQAAAEMQRQNNVPNVFGGEGSNEPRNFDGMSDNKRSFIENRSKSNTMQDIKNNLSQFQADITNKLVGK